MGFRSKLRIELDGRQWKLIAYLVWRTASENIVVPAGFVTDLDSVPRLPFVYLLFKNRSQAPAVLHDWLYREAKRPRKWCDAIFLKAMIADRVPWWQRRPIWLAVRLFGGPAYGRTDKASMRAGGGHAL